MKSEADDEASDDADSADEDDDSMLRREPISSTHVEEVELSRCSLLRPLLLRVCEGRAFDLEASMVFKFSGNKSWMAK